LNKAYKVVSPSDYLKHAFAKAGFHNIQVIPNSIELEKYEFKARENVQPKLLWVRSFADIYNPLMAVKVLEALKTSFPEAQLTMVGPDKDGSLELCKNWADEKGLSVTFTGLLPKTEWTILAATHDIFINTSRFDNMPVGVIEAMALGLPVVSTDVGGIPFMIQNRVNGMLVPDNDVLAMKLAIEELIENPQLGCDISMKAKDYMEKLDWLHIKTLWNNLLAQ
jgi:glycosyltransferase involved in cell wall biosynthesis